MPKTATESRRQDPFNVLRPFKSGSQVGCLYSLPALEEMHVPGLSRLPVSLRIVLESVLRNCDGVTITPDDVTALARWKATAPDSGEIPFVVSRILLQDFTGVPLLVDLAAMRDAVQALGKDPTLIEPLVPVDLVVDHSVHVDRSGTADAFQANLKLEFERNRERYELLKWGQQAFQTLSVVPPAIGIVHQVNLEYLAKGVFAKQDHKDTLIFYPDTLVGTDSHTTMINGLGVVGWGVGGIEAEAGMLGQPIYFLTPKVVGVHLTGTLREGVTATDLTLAITRLLRHHNVVGTFVEFFGDGAARLSVSDRATIANMAPEYGATMGFFPVDEQTLEYLTMTGRAKDTVRLVEEYFKAQGLFGMPHAGQLDYTETLELDLESITPSVAGPKRPQDSVSVPNLKEYFQKLLLKKEKEGGFGLTPDTLSHENSAHISGNVRESRSGDTPSPPPINHGSVVIAAITSCTNTSNPSVMIAAGLLAQKAIQHGLTVPPTVKSSLAPGSRVVTDYLEATGLQKPLDQLGFHLVGYGCTTCIGNSGPLDASVETTIKERKLVTASVLSGNRNFEARIHPSIRANFLMSPPLVVAYAIAGRVDIDLGNEPLGIGKEGNPVYLRQIWPTQTEIQEKIAAGLQPAMFTRRYQSLHDNPEWDTIETLTDTCFQWRDDSTYIRKPPFFASFSHSTKTITNLCNLRALAIFGDSVTTDHISPAGAIPPDGPAGQYLQTHGIPPKAFNSFGSRRGNDCVMTRGTFANVRIRNLMANGREGGWTRLMPEDEPMTIYEACQRYAKRGTQLIVFAGHDYGMGSSRDWAAKGTYLLGVKAVVAQSFERIHRSNLVGMGVLPLQFKKGESAQSLQLNGSETFSVIGLAEDLKPKKEVVLYIQKPDGTVAQAQLEVRIDTPVEIDYYRNGGILAYVLRQLLTEEPSHITKL